VFSTGSGSGTGKGSGWSAGAESDHFAPVRVNETLTLLFDQDTSFDSHHYAFHVSDGEFDAIFERIKKAELSYGSAPWSLDDGELNDWNGAAEAFTSKIRTATCLN
jgi:hypothetical protein